MFGTQPMTMGRCGVLLKQNQALGFGGMPFMKQQWQRLGIHNGGNMLNRIRTFFGREKGLHPNKATIVEQGSAWYCTECRLVFITKVAGDKHSCEYRFQDSIVKMRMNDERKERI
jgi:hypothetical protein